MTPLIVLGLILMLWTILCAIRKKRTPPKYRLGDKVRFAYRITIGSDYVHIGEIWKIHKSWLCEPSYEIYNQIGSYSGSNYTISESDIIELIQRSNEIPHNPFKPAK